VLPMQGETGQDGQCGKHSEKTAISDTMQSPKKWRPPSDPAGRQRSLNQLEGCFGGALFRSGDHRIYRRMCQ